jgi:cytochrome c-type biogenesis protein CcmH
VTPTAWAGVALLCVVALAFAVAPLLRRGASSAEARRRLNVALYRDRLTELTAEVARGEIAPADRESLEAELALSLLEDARPADLEVPGSATGHRGLALALALVVVGGAVMVYRQIGAYDLVVLDRDRSVLSEEGVSEDRLDAWARRLETHLARQPDDAKSWYLLGHARLRQDRFDGAVAAFETLTRLTGDDAAVLSALAQARYLADEGVVSADTHALMRRVLALSPHEPNVREMLALDAFRRGRFDEAAEHLESALAGGVGGARAEALRHALERARAASSSVPPAAVVGIEDANAAPTAVSTAPRQPAETAPEGSIRVRVAFAPGVAAHPPARVFVIAREAGGPPMPVAVRVLDPEQLPAEVVLSDADAMQPGRGLSSFERVDVVARLSRSGSAVRAEGDLESGVVSIVRSEGQAAREAVSLAIGG